MLRELSEVAAVDEVYVGAGSCPTSAAAADEAAGKAPGEASAASLSASCCGLFLLWLLLCRCFSSFCCWLGLLLLL